jgi:hypothetical protein
MPWPEGTCASSERVVKQLLRHSPASHPNGRSQHSAKRVRKVYFAELRPDVADRAKIVLAEQPKKCVSFHAVVQNKKSTHMKNTTDV